MSCVDNMLIPSTLMQNCSEKKLTRRYGYFVASRGKFTTVLLKIKLNENMNANFLHSRIYCAYSVIAGYLEKNVIVFLLNIKFVWKMHKFLASFLLLSVFIDFCPSLEWLARQDLRMVAFYFQMRSF